MFFNCEYKKNNNKLPQPYGSTITYPMQSFGSILVRWDYVL